MLARIVSFQLIAYLYENNLLTDYQSATWRTGGAVLNVFSAIDAIVSGLHMLKTMKDVGLHMYYASMTYGPTSANIMYTSMEDVYLCADL